MNTIKTTAPISIDDLRKYFLDNTITYEIDYKNSKLKGQKLLTYLSNLDIPCDIAADFDEEFLDLVKDYFNSPILLSVNILESIAMEILFCNRFGLTETASSQMSNEKMTKFISENKDIIDHWSKVLDSLTVYNMQTVDVPEFKEFVESHPLDETNDLKGINFVQLLKYQDFYLFYNKINREWLTNYRTYFNEYMFKSKNLYFYWANENNPMFLFTFGVANELMTSDEYRIAVNTTVKELENVSSI
jgi:hypothetical protein